MTSLPAGSPVLLQREGRSVAIEFAGDGLAIPMGMASFARAGRELGTELYGLAQPSMSG